LSGANGIRKMVMISFLVVVLIVLSVFMVAAARAESGDETTQSKGVSQNQGLAFLAAAAATGFGCIGAGIAVAYVGAAAVAAVGEKPEVAGRTLIFVGLAEGVAIYGLIIAIMILGKV
jgi:V/A-type H+-transporting ATPase subunit K